MLFKGSSHPCGLYSIAKTPEPQRRFHAMLQTSGAGLGFVKLSDSDYVLAHPEQDIRRKDAYDADGRRMGSVDDLYIDRQERRVRFLEVGAGGFLGMGQKHLLVPVEAVSEVAEGQVTIEPGRSKKVAGDPPFDTTLAPPTTGHRRDATPPWWRRS
jgi:sporulation protein YlmC with PRC-barrel domain